MTRTYLKDLTPEEVVRRLKNGERVYIENVKSSYYKMIDGVLCRCENYGDIVYNDSMIITDTPKNKRFFETEEPFKITHTGLYKTRDGRKAFISSIDKDEPKVFGMVEGDACITVWFLEGLTFKGYEFPKDIVSEWSKEDAV